MDRPHGRSRFAPGARPRAGAAGAGGGSWVRGRRGVGADCGLARADADALDAAASAAATDADREPSCAWLAGLDPAVRTRVLRGWLGASGAGDVGADHVAAVERLVVAWSGQRGVDVPGGQVVRQGNALSAEAR